MAAFCFGVKEINQGDLYNSSNEKLKTMATYIADREQNKTEKDKSNSL